MNFPQMDSPMCCSPVEVHILLKALRNKQALLGIVPVQHKIWKRIYIFINVLSKPTPHPPVLTWALRLLKHLLKKENAPHSP